MEQRQVPHFEEQGRINPRQSTDRMPEVIYSTALDYLVFTCVDIAFLFENQILLARRNRYPRQSWWLIGGRMVAGENPLDTARRKVWEEAGLELARTRFQYVGAYSTCFAKRQQEPSHHGSHSLNLTYFVQLFLEERNQIQLQPEEYEADWVWIGLEGVGELLDQNDVLDQALLRVMQDLYHRIIV